LRSAIERLNRDEFVFISLSIETNLSNDDLSMFADWNEYDWLFTLATPEMLQALSEEYGRRILHPSATPHLIIGKQGEILEFHVGGLLDQNELVDRLTLFHEG
jgi:hypothetical protein